VKGKIKKKKIFEGKNCKCSASEKERERIKNIVLEGNYN
jgi:hypothetical protein